MCRDDARACAAYVLAEGLGGEVAHGHHALFRPFAVDYHEAVVKVDLRQLQLAQLAHAQAASV